MFSKFCPSLYSTLSQTKVWSSASNNNLNHFFTSDSAASIFSNNSYCLLTKWMRFFGSGTAEKCIIKSHLCPINFIPSASPWWKTSWNQCFQGFDSAVGVESMRWTWLPEVHSSVSDAGVWVDHFENRQHWLQPRSPVEAGRYTICDQSQDARLKKLDVQISG